MASVLHTPDPSSPAASQTSVATTCSSWPGVAPCPPPPNLLLTSHFDAVALVLPSAWAHPSPFFFSASGASPSLLRNPALNTPLNSAPRLPIPLYFQDLFFRNPADCFSPLMIMYTDLASITSNLELCLIHSRLRKDLLTDEGSLPRVIK